MSTVPTDADLIRMGIEARLEAIAATKAPLEDSLALDECSGCRDSSRRHLRNLLDEERTLRQRLTALDSTRKDKP